MDCLDWLHWLLAWLVVGMAALPELPGPAAGCWLACCWLPAGCLLLAAGCVDGWLTAGCWLLAAGWLLAAAAGWLLAAAGCD